jgi:hypothetical protein
VSSFDVDSAARTRLTQCIAEALTALAKMLGANKNSPGGIQAWTTQTLNRKLPVAIAENVFV